MSETENANATENKPQTPLVLLKAKGKIDPHVVAVLANGKVTDLHTPVDPTLVLTPVLDTEPAGLRVIRHSTAHVMADAVQRLFPGTHVTIGPAIDDGFYYDFEKQGGGFTEDDLRRIEEVMAKIVEADTPFRREVVSRDEAIKMFTAMGEHFKVDIINSIPEGEEISLYKHGGSETWVDVCEGPHVPSTRYLKAVKLTHVAGAYWRGDEKNAQLQRIYGTAWESDAALSAHLEQLAQAELRDHRKLGQELDLFSFPGEIGSGLAVFHPKGGTMRRVMEEYSRQRHEASGYDFVYSPHITKSDLFEISGHLEWFAESMYPPMELDGGTKYYLKPMNCPFHTLIFKSSQRSYRDLPLRYFEFGSVYRYEKSGAVHGLTRVRGMTMDDAHIFCTKEQMAEELTRTLQFVLDLLRDFGLNEFYLELSTRPPGKAVGTDAEWDEAESTLASVALAAGLDLVMDPGGGAFYGPKISVQARDAIGRTHQMSTVQLDFQTPQRFDASYVAADNTRTLPIMIHRALFGSVERFMAILLEHYAGNMPTWLCPEQVRVLGVRDDHDVYAAYVAETLALDGIRVSVEEANEPLGARIRRAKLEKIPYILVVGDDDVEKGTLGVNARGSNDPDRGVEVAAFRERVLDEIATHGSPEGA